MDEDTKAADRKTRKKRRMPNETKRERFERIADARTNQVLDKLRILGGLANSRYYDYSQEDVKVIFDAIFEELESTRSKFLSSTKEETKFRLEDRLKNGDERFRG